MDQSAIVGQQLQHTNIKIPKHLAAGEALGQIYNVLIILAITLLMAVTTAAIAYFVDLMPAAFDSGTRLAANRSLGYSVD